MAERLRHSEQKPSTPDSMRPHTSSSSRTSSEPLHDHTSAAGQCTVRARSEATMFHPARHRSHPPDHLPADRSAGNEHELEDEDYDNDIEDDRQPQQEAKGDVGGADWKVGDAHLSDEKDESPAP
ncbi:uncharacterized protein PAC_06128 [Phialocephala subalpina]|uniref:Uncharacterized protein n=1 Tax=Phialocephala subalpina TaxID=576137 RepID=A0A1L7WU24_9HELO|nr:uncharacterized protein PAC_06128 [Phialocephala subalpina]